MSLKETLSKVSAAKLVDILVSLYEQNKELQKPLDMIFAGLEDKVCEEGRKKLPDFSYRSPVRGFLRHVLGFLMGDNEITRHQFLRLYQVDEACVVK